MVKKWLSYIVPALIIGLISFYDAYLVMRTYYGVESLHQLLEFEQNPVGRWLIVYGGSPSYFVCIKVCTTVLVLLCLAVIYKKAPRFYPFISTTLVLFQIGLLTFLEWN